MQLLVTDISFWSFLLLSCIIGFLWVNQGTPNKHTRTKAYHSLFWMHVRYEGCGTNEDVWGTQRKLIAIALRCTFSSGAWGWCLLQHKSGENAHRFVSSYICGNCVWSKMTMCSPTAISRVVYMWAKDWQKGVFWQHQQHLVFVVSFCLTTLYGDHQSGEWPPLLPVMTVSPSPLIHRPSTSPSTCTYNLPTTQTSIEEFSSPFYLWRPSWTLHSSALFGVILGPWYRCLKFGREKSPPSVEEKNEGESSCNRGGCCE